MGKSGKLGKWKRGWKGVAGIGTRLKRILGFRRYRASEQYPQSLLPYAGLGGFISEHRAFMGACSQTVEDVNWPQADLYARLVGEEVAELADAMEARDRVKALDGLADLIVVITGVALSLDLPLDAGLREVARSNSTKIGPEGRVVKRDDGKVLKPEGYSPPELGPLVYAHDVTRWCYLY